MDIKTELESIFGNGKKPYAAYPYQIQVARALLDGKNIILRAPTGAGKTEAALGPFLLAREHERDFLDFPRRCIIASPMRTLAKDLFERAQKAAPNLTVKLHTGEDPTDPLLEADILITTYDQLLSNYLHVPYSQSWRSRNIGAGGVVASYIVLDEFHLFDPVRAFRTTLEMARALHGITPFVFMTATMSAKLTEKLAKAVGAEFVTPSETELATMQSQQKIRSIRRVDAVLMAEAVANAHEQRSIAIANTVGRVQALYADLQRLKVEGHSRLKDTKLVMIHSRYFPTHRNAHEVRLKALLHRDSKENVILVASQAVEVGIDISSEQLHTELCPANALLQRAGRNARYAGEIGVVSVYDLPRDENDEWQMLPYAKPPLKNGKDDAERLVQIQVLKDTWEALADLPSPVKPEDEESLVDRVHTAGDLANWQGYEQSRTSTFRDKMIAAFGGERAARSDLIRDIQNISVLMVKGGTELSSWAEVNRHERLSVTWVNFAALEENRQKLGLEHDLAENWLVKVPCETESEAKAAESETRQPTKLNWIPATNAAELQGQPLVLVNPKFIFYNRNEGFRWEAPEGGRLGVNEVDIPEGHAPRPTGEGGDYWYVYETYEEHIQRVLSSAEKHASDVWHICLKVDKKFGLPIGTTTLALKATIAAHDIGKLSEGWQNWTRGWQAKQVKHYGSQPLWDGKSTAKGQAAGEYCAHTDYHPKYDKQRNKDFDRQGRRPPHAGESAAIFMAAFGGVLKQRIGDEAKTKSIVYGVAGAVARHHSAAATGETSAWKLDADAAAEARRVFSEIAGDELDAAVMEKLQQSGIKAVLKPLPLAPTNSLAWLIYTLASRALRLGDTRSFEDVRQKKEAES
ncbi:CRISPR-associated helicase Cas3' [Deinococcus antarcticus]|uniref:CRISPR-associated helicase Cas3 n=1 Tax=Deinococcus antarcticus TaxID=1298767 RepID=A0ABV8ABF3_9DEIO